jgi:hypothetical protein
MSFESGSFRPEELRKLVGVEFFYDGLPMVVGELVRLNSNSPDLLVVEVNDVTAALSIDPITETVQFDADIQMVTVAWKDGHKPCERDFNRKMLHRVAQFPKYPFDF